MIRCPRCGESYYVENYSTSTAMYCPPVFQNGICISEDHNIYNTYCTCLSCGNNFYYSNRESPLESEPDMRPIYS